MTPSRLSSRWMYAQSGWTRSCTGAAGGSNRASRAASFSSTGGGQPNPPRAALRRYSETVPTPIAQAWAGASPGVLPGREGPDGLHVLPRLERKHRAVAEATALLDWRLAPVWQQARAELAKHTRKPDQEWVRMLRLMEAHPAAAVERGDGRPRASFPAPGNGAAHPPEPGGRPAPGVPAGHRDASGAGAESRCRPQPSMNGSISVDATEIAHRRGDSGSADAVGAACDAAEAGRIAGEARVSSTVPRSPPPARPVRGTATQPHRTLLPPRKRAAHHRRNACDTEDQPRGGHAGEQSEASRHDQTRENRRSQAERAGGRGAGGLAGTPPRSSG